MDILLHFLIYTDEEKLHGYCPLYIEHFKMRIFGKKNLISQRIKLRIWTGILSILAGHCPAMVHLQDSIV